MRNKFLLLGICLSQLLLAQDQTDIANYMVYHPLVNPAANGSFSDLAGIIYGRKQWYSIEGAPAIFGAQAVKSFKKISFGLSLMHQSIGVHSEQKGFITYTYKIKFLRNHTIAFGMSPGAVFKTSNYNKINTTTGSDDQFTGSKSIVRPDFNFGIYYLYERFYAGISVPSLVKNTIGVYEGELSGSTSVVPSYWHYYLLAGYNFELGNKLDLNLSTLTKKFAGAPVDFDLNINMVYNDAFGGGVSYRTRREVLFFTNIKLTSSVKMGYSYHVYFNIENQMLSGHEIFITYNYLRSRQASIQSPRF